jgi:DNA polymerase-3 subunit alpha
VFFFLYAYRNQITIEGPNVNESLYEFSIKDDKTILYGLGAIKGVGESLIEVLVTEREAYGEYRNLFVSACLIALG